MVAEACEGVHVEGAFVHVLRCELRFASYPASSQPFGLLSTPRQANLERTEVRGSDDGIMAGVGWVFLRLFLYVLSWVLIW